ncbi:hypothetical protein ANCCAN_02480 [Ancylostoma caninum]|uniref:Uncharacterized protein n=1 Tax=Ancylostoma caninum TaxID=29170 RepID=A0A368H7Q1_ANCCA|nr:hypothetical protein ANCCAN_02480 [Ancylostoma caninum]
MFQQKSRFFVFSLFDEADDGVKARSEQKVKFSLDGKSTTAGNRIYYNQQRDYSRDTRSLLRRRQGKRQFMKDELISKSETSGTEVDSWIERDDINMSSDPSSWSNFASSRSATSSVSLAPPTPAPLLRRPATQGQKAKIDGVT